MTLTCRCEAIQTRSRHGTIIPMSRTLLVSLAALLLACCAMAQQAPASGKRVRRLLIHNAIVVDGNGTPASGPKDIVIENNMITDVIPLDAVAAARGSRGAAQADAVIDATGKYVLPGLINAHAHLQDERGGKPQPLEYELNIWLACGITDGPRRGQRHEARARNPQAERRRRTRRAAHFRLSRCSAARAMPRKRAPACSR